MSCNLGPYHVGDQRPLEVQFIEQDGRPKDISGVPVAGREFYIRSPSGTISGPLQAVFTDSGAGTDGVLRYNSVSSTFPAQGIYQFWARINNSTANPPETIQTGEYNLEVLQNR